ncbi:MAG: NFACT family protein [Bacilli bacterium]|jgi:predicted ribosome quality control (RQC) complex YloA/Tae2 family protein|nr:NFACT family protein [Bacilli bacterium]
MPLSAKELTEHVKTVEPKVKGRRLFRVVPYSESVFFAILSGKDPKRLAIVLSDEDPRIYLAPDGDEAPALESKFADLLRKELTNACLADAGTINDDRVVRLSFSVVNAVYKEEKRNLYFELIPHHANLILTDADGKILGAFRQGSLEDERPLLRGTLYQSPRKKPFAKEERGGFDESSYEEDCLKKESDLAARRKKDRFGYLFEALKRQKKLLERKIRAIEGDLANAKTHLGDGAYGDYIFMNMGDLPQNAASLSVDGKEIPLDPRRNLSQNAQLFHKRAKKAKATVAMGASNLRKAETELAETSNDLALLERADEEGLEGLAASWGLEPTRRIGRRKGGERASFRLPREITPRVVDYKGTKILFGKSAKENDCLTFLLDTSKGHAWLHVEGTTGSHVMIKKDDPSEDEIRLAAEICLLNSGLESGEVMIAKRGDVRKGRAPGQAIVKAFRTICLKEVSPLAKSLLRQAKKAELAR